MSFQKQILNWYDQHRRDLPWRAARGETADPYHVWLSEIMLQQTTVATVKSYFLKFLDYWPDVHGLAGADLDDVLAAWAGLGYYARARNLHACARIVAEQHQGIFPSDASELLKLPGIGPYTSGAIAAIAFDQSVVAVDGNVERVMSRYYAIETPLPDSKPLIKEKTVALVPKLRAGDFAQSLMDLGATICTPRSPNCPLCPLQKECAGLEIGIAASLPKKQPKKARPNRHGKAFVVVRNNGDILLRRRPEKGLLGGMLEVPCSEWVDGKLSAPCMIEHTFTHFHLTLEVIVSDNIDGAEIRDLDTHVWVQPNLLFRQALPTVMKKVLIKALGSDVLKT